MDDNELFLFPEPVVYSGPPEWLHIGEYGNHKVFVSSRVPRGHVAMAGQFSDIQINDEAYALLRQSPRSASFIELICASETSSDNTEEPGMPGEDKEVLEYLAGKGYFDYIQPPPEPFPLFPNRSKDRS